LARYYFDVHDGEQLLHDDEGSEFDSLDGAMQAAARSATEIGTSWLARGDTSDVVIEVRDERNQRVGTITASMVIKQHVSQSQEPHPWSA
jgi:hypothetical protein